MITGARAQTAGAGGAAGPASGASTSGLGGEGAGAGASPAPAGVAAEAGAARPTPDAPAPAPAGDGGADYLALLIEHGPGWWPFFAALVLLILLLTRRDLNLSFGRDGMKAEVARSVDALEGDAHELYQLVRAQEARLAQLEAAGARAGAPEDAPADAAGAKGGRGRAGAVLQDREDRAPEGPGPRADSVGEAPRAAAAGGPPEGDRPSAPAGRTAPGAGPEAAAVHDRLLRALGHDRFVWRSIDRLALETGVDEPRVRDMLAGRPDLFVLGRGVSGRDIARLAARTPER